MLAVKSLLATGLGLANADSSVKKVIELLGELKGKVEAETAQGQKDSEEYSDWCIKTTTELEADVKYGSAKAEELAAAQEKGTSSAAAAGAEIATLAPEIQKLGASQKEATKVRKDEHATFVKEEAELVEADTMLQKAYAVLKRSLSFVQAGESPNTHMQDVVTALGAIIDSAWMDAESNKRIKSFLEESDSLSLHQPQAQTSNYQSKSGGILDAIQGMQEKNAEVLGKLREKDMSARHAYELLVQDLTNQQQNKEEQVASLQEQQAKQTAVGKQAGADLATAQETLKADTEELTSTKGGCVKYAKEWSARKAEAEQEIAVIAQATDILNGKFGGESLLQVKVDVNSENEFHKRAEAGQLLRKLSREFNSFGLMQVATSAQDDPFVKVRGMIKEMITKLEDGAEKEATKEAKCKADKAKGEKNLKIKKADFGKLTSRSDSAEATFAKLGEEIQELGEQLKQGKADAAAATKLRNKEKSDNNATIKDAAESVEALSGAIKVLNDFYGGAPSFLQVTENQPKSDAANMIMEILSTAQEDFEKLKQATESQESAAADKYAKEVQAAQVSDATKTAEKQGKVKERAGVKVQMSQITEDLAEATKALDAANAFLKGVKEACANKAMSYEERQKRRADEIKGLQEALQILSADEGGEFLQTGFMSRK